MPHGQIVEGEKVVAFSAAAARVRRPRADEDAERGRLLLFTGVRYERVDLSCRETDPWPSDEVEPIAS